MRDSLTMHYDVDRDVWQVKDCNELVTECRVLIVETKPIKGWCAFERVERPYTREYALRMGAEAVVCGEG